MLTVLLAVEPHYRLAQDTLTSESPWVHCNLYLHMNLPSLRCQEATGILAQTANLTINLGCASVISGFLSRRKCWSPEDCLVMLLTEHE